MDAVTAQLVQAQCDKLLEIIKQKNWHKDHIVVILSNRIICPSPTHVIDMAMKYVSHVAYLKKMESNTVQVAIGIDRALKSLINRNVAAYIYMAPPRSILILEVTKELGMLGWDKYMFTRRGKLNLAITTCLELATNGKCFPILIAEPSIQDKFEEKLRQINSTIYHRLMELKHLLFEVGDSTILSHLDPRPAQALSRVLPERHLLQ